MIKMGDVFLISRFFGCGLSCDYRQLVCGLWVKGAKAEKRKRDEDIVSALSFQPF